MKKKTMCVLTASLMLAGLLAVNSALATSETDIDQAIASGFAEEVDGDAGGDESDVLEIVGENVAEGVTETVVDA